jgi:hypothetical protein
MLRRRFLGLRLCLRKCLEDRVQALCQFDGGSWRNHQTMRDVNYLMASKCLPLFVHERTLTSAVGTAEKCQQMG